MVKLLIFDMDGTLVDTDEVLYQTWKELFIRYKPKDYKIDREFIRGFSGPPIEESIHRAFPEFDPKFIKEKYTEATRKYYTDEFLRMFPSSKEVLAKLKEEGYILTIGTSKNRKMTEYCLKKFGFYDYFDSMITSTDPYAHKPDPAIINALMERYKVSESETLMIGDTSFDALAARNAHVKSVLVRLCPRIYEKDKLPDYFVDSYDELYNLIKTL